MKRLVSFNLAIVLLLLIVTPSFGGGPGTTGSRFLNIGMGARPIGMGNAFTAVANDINALYWNPAGLIFTNAKEGKLREVTATHIEWFESVGYEYLGYCQSLIKNNAIGVNISYLHTTDIRRDEVGVEQGSFQNYDLALGVSYAHDLSSILFSGLCLGVNAKAIYRTLDKEKASGIVFDIGSLYHIGDIPISSITIPDLSLGLVFQNVGPPVKFKEKSDPMPTNLKLGVASRMLDNRLTLAIDIMKRLSGGWHASLGGEYFFAKWLAIRTGYKSGFDIKGLVGLTCGIGFNLKNKYKVDYAFAPYGDLGSTHQISLIVRF